MDPNGRLMMPGFVGESFEETGVAKEAVATERDFEPTNNRHARRKMEAIDRLAAKQLQTPKEMTHE